MFDHAIVLVPNSRENRTNIGLKDEQTDRVVHPIKEKIEPI